MYIWPEKGVVKLVIRTKDMANYALYVGSQQVSDNRALTAQIGCFFSATISLKASSGASIGSIPQRLGVDTEVNGVSRTSQAAIVSRFTAGNRYICAGLHVPLHVLFSVWSVARALVD